MTCSSLSRAQSRQVNRSCGRTSSVFRRNELCNVQSIATRRNWKRGRALIVPSRGVMPLKGTILSSTCGRVTGSERTAICRLRSQISLRAWNKAVKKSRVSWKCVDLLVDGAQFTIHATKTCLYVGTNQEYTGRLSLVAAAQHAFTHC